MGSGVSYKGATSGPCQASTGIMKIGMDPLLSKEYMTLDQNGKVQAELLDLKWHPVPSSFAPAFCLPPLASFQSSCLTLCYAPARPKVRLDRLGLLGWTKL